MKTTFTIITLILSAHCAYSQLTLTNQYNPIAGDVDSYAICDTVNITQGNSGANQTWSYLNLTRVDSTDVTFVTSASTPYSGQFATSNVASSNDNSSFNYFTTSAANILFNGNGNPAVVIPYSNPQLYMQYPFTYNTSFSDNFGSNYISNGTPTVRSGTINVTGDAWGTINLPIGSFPNALRVKYIISTKDSSNPGSPIVFVTNTTSYVWFVPGKKYPVFEIVYSTLFFNGTLFASSKTVNYNASSTPIGIEQISSEVPENFRLTQNYPNPFNPATKIRFSIPASPLSFGEGLAVRLTVYDNLGREVAVLVNEELSPGVYGVSFDAAKYSSGAYYYRLSAGNYSETKKMILIK